MLVDTRFLVGVVTFAVLVEVVEGVAVEALASFEGVVVPLLLFFYVTVVGLAGYYRRGGAFLLVDKALSVFFYLLAILLVAVLREGIRTASSSSF